MWLHMISSWVAGNGGHALFAVCLIWLAFATVRKIFG